ncbi:unnamed protein product [Acanthoscelides obtectus]|uniref:RDD domain-containing protein n=1 Tax=Acanthoscelides obtectus TaxID=200917 RepID=A0A9P0PAF6_ACAOB|nr:unnamed protein product [Acanthoscelides obtectus]CAK1642664.1 Protein FAM8A1 [Acanthoscelides obtectus]
MVENQSPKERSDDEEPESETEKQLSREEYMEILKKWLDDARSWQYNVCAMFPPSLFLNHQLHSTYNNLWYNPLQGFTTSSTTSNINTFYQASTRFSPPGTYEFVISPLWKRAVAEMMDFLLLFLIKMALTFLLIESFDIIDLSLYGYESFQKHLEDPNMAMPMAVELLTLELLHRVIVAAYETFFLKGKQCATPGKRYMGLIVITAESITPVPGRANETIAVTGASVLSWRKALGRALLKNLFVGLFLPLCVAFYIFPHNRTSYDMMSNSIVVEYHHEFMVLNGRD